MAGKLAYLALGSNLGDRKENLALAISQLRSDEIRILRESPLYETEPQYVTDQPWFLNQVIEIETDLFPLQLLSRCNAIERALGRKPGTRNQARKLDIDILFYGDVIMSSKDLDIPHPRIAERRFVLAPLADLAPALRHPQTKRTVKEMLDSLKGPV